MRPTGQVAIGDTRPLMDMVRDELPGHAAGPLVNDGWILARTYTPEDAGVYRSMKMTVRRFSGSAAARAEMDACGDRAGVREVERTRAAGVDGVSFVDGSDLVLAIPDGPYLFELRLTLASSDGGTLVTAREAAVDLIETLLD